MGCRQHQLDSPLHYEVPPNNNGQAFIIRLLFGFVSQSFCIQYLLNSKNNNNPSQSSSLSNTITARRELITRLGRRLLFPTPSSCLAAVAVQQGSLQRLCQVKNRIQASIYLIPGGGTFQLKHSGEWACGIPDGETIVLTGGNYVTRC